MPIKVHRPGAYKETPKSEERIKLPPKLRSNPPPKSSKRQHTLQTKKVRFT